MIIFIDMGFVKRYCNFFLLEVIFVKKKLLNERKLSILIMVWYLFLVY